MATTWIAGDTVDDVATTENQPRARHRILFRGVLRMLVAAGLAVDAYVHWNLAPSFDGVTGHGNPHISQGQLFRLEAVMALLTAVLALVVRRRWTVAPALLVAAGGLAAVLLYQYVDVGALGPVPNMYDPGWYVQKTVSAIAETLSAVAALLCMLPMAVPKTTAGRGQRGDSDSQRRRRQIGRLS